jgi:acetate kinase
MNVLVLNAGSNSLKFEVIAVEPNITTPDQGKKLVSCIIEGIGSDAVVANLSGKEVIHKQQITTASYKDATLRALEWLNSKQASGVSTLDNIDIVGHRVVHGTDKFSASVLIDEEVISKLGGAEAIVFGGGIGENTLKVREKVCKGFEWCGLKLDSECNQRVIDVEGCISTPEIRKLPTRLSLKLHLWEDERLQYRQTLAKFRRFANYLEKPLNNLDTLIF